MKCIIVDDETFAISALKKELNLFVPDVEVMHTCKTLIEAKKSIEKWKPEIVFLDIKMDDGLGLDLVHDLDYHDFDLIFTTAYSHYAIDALRLGAADYLMKPICGDDIVDSLERIKLRKLQIHSMDTSQQESFMFHHHGEKIIFSFNEIIRFQSLGNYSWVYPQNEKAILIPLTLKQIESKCPDFFIRCHKSHIVNLHFIQSYNAKLAQIQIKSGSTIPVSMRKKSIVLKSLK